MSSEWNLTGFVYSITLMIVVMTIIMGGNLLHIDDVTWALISGVICTELEAGQSQPIVHLRIVATLIGVVLASLILILLGPGYPSILLGTIVICLVCHYVIPVETNWKLATATGVIVLVAGLQQHSLQFAEIIALKRALEVTVGSLVAGIISFILRYFWMYLKKRK